MFCNTCNISFHRKFNYERHLQTKFHTQNLEKDITLAKSFVCLCGKSFSMSNSLSRHKKKCNYVPQNQQQHTTEIQNLTKENNEMREIICKQENEIRYVKDEMSKEMNDLRKQVEILLQQSGKKTTNNSNIKNQNNIENMIVVNSFGHENIDHLTDQIICKLIKTAPFTSVPLLIEKIHFDPDHPENHNIKITNKKLNYAEVVRDNKWVTANKKKVIDDVIQKSYDLLDEKYTENKEDISEKRQERFQNFQEKYEQADEDLLRNIKNDVDLLLINGTN
jgi:uncharacterized Zn-finger protein